LTDLFDKLEQDVRLGLAALRRELTLGYAF